MSAAATPPFAAGPPLEVPPVRTSALARPSPLRRAVFAPLKLLCGMMLTQSLPGSVAVAGWTYRLMQRQVLKHWWARSAHASGGGRFEDFLAAHPEMQTHLHWPNWLLEQNCCRAFHRAENPGAWIRLKQGGKACVHSLGRNLQLGAQAIFNTWVLTMPACALWLFAWYDGWNNSFTKGYEQAGVGPSLGVLGIILFIAAMLYVPLAQARHAATGQWRAFYQFRLVWDVARRRCPACAGLALLYSLLSAPITILKSAPAFLQNNRALADLTPAQAVKFLEGYYFWSALFVFPAFVFLRLMAARIYAGGVLDAVQSGRWPVAQLAEFERASFERLELLRVRPPVARHFFVRAVAWFATRTGRACATIALLGIWFTFVAQIFIAEFLNYHPVIGWLNQVLVQLPLFNHIPGR